MDRSKAYQPKLPTFVRVMTIIDMLLSAGRLLFVFILLYAVSMTPPPPHKSALYVSLALNAAIFGLGLGGGAAMLTRDRNAPYIQAVSALCAVFLLPIGVLVNLAEARSGRGEGVTFGLMVGIAIVLSWEIGMFRSIQSALSYFRFTEIPQRATLKDLERLGPSVDFRDLDLAGNPQVNDTFCARLSDYRSLVRLGLSKTPISDDSVRKLAWMGRLESLDLSQTNVSDAIFTLLAGASSLKELNVTGTKCTAQGLADFREVRQSEHPMLGEVRVELVEGAEVPIKAQVVDGSPTANPFKPEVASAEGDAALNAFLSTIDQTPSVRKPGSRES